MNAEEVARYGATLSAGANSDYTTVAASSRSSSTFERDPTATTRCRVLRARDPANRSAIHPVPRIPQPSPSVMASLPAASVAIRERP